VAVKLGTIFHFLSFQIFRGTAPPALRVICGGVGRFARLKNALQRAAQGFNKRVRAWSVIRIDRRCVDQIERRVRPA
jgi:hypothetical protein